MSAALAAVDAHRATARGLNALFDELRDERGIRAIAAGKAAVGMAAAAQEAFGDRLVDAVLTASTSQGNGESPPRSSGAAGPGPPSQGYGGPGPRWRAFSATHPRPSAESEAAGRAALALADESRRAGGLLIVCLSGGTSAMLAVPAAGLTIADKAATTSRLLLAGLDIGEMNVVRRHLSAIKGGQLAARAGRTITLAISDVCTPVDDDPVVIGSGPTVGDDSSFADALNVVRRHGVAAQLPPAVIAHLEAGVAGTVSGPVRTGDPRLKASAYWVVASRHDAMRAAADTARALGYHVRTRTAPTIGEARLAAGDLLEEARGLSRPACLIASGETTVHVLGGGRGGRNQELAVAALEPLAALGPAALASIGTDGCDGPTDAAGAIVDSSTWASLGSPASTLVRQALQKNDVSPFLDSLGALVRTGPTGTNVGDLQIVLLE